MAQASLFAAARHHKAIPTSTYRTRVVTFKTPEAYKPLTNYIADTTTIEVGTDKKADVIPIPSSAVTPIQLDDGSHTEGMAPTPVFAELVLHLARADAPASKKNAFILLTALALNGIFVSPEAEVIAPQDGTVNFQPLSNEEKELITGETWGMLCAEIHALTVLTCRGGGRMKSAKIIDRMNGILKGTDEDFKDKRIFNIFKHSISAEDVNDWIGGLIFTIRSGPYLNQLFTSLSKCQDIRGSVIEFKTGLNQRTGIALTAYKALVNSSLSVVKRYTAQASDLKQFVKATVDAGFASHSRYLEEVRPGGIDAFFPPDLYALGVELINLASPGRMKMTSNVVGKLLLGKETAKNLALKITEILGTLSPEDLTFLEVDGTTSTHFTEILQGLNAIY